MKERHLGVIDSLSAGLNAIISQVWVIAIPIALDCWYWLGPRLSVAPLVRQLQRFLGRSPQAGLTEMPLSIADAQQILEAIARHFNLFSLLSASLLGVPSLMADHSAGVGGVIEIRSWLAFIGLVAVLVLVGSAIGCLYLTLIAQGLPGQKRPDAQDILRQAGLTWLRIVGLGLIALFFAVSLAVPFSFLVALVTLVSAGAASFLLGLFYVSIIWIVLYLYFVVDAIVINGVGPLRAIWNSANVVARNFWSALALIILIAVLSLGLSFVWRGLSDLHPVGTVVAISANAFIGSGLVAASLIFYRDRYVRWQAKRKPEVGTYG